MLVDGNRSVVDVVDLCLSGLTLLLVLMMIDEVNSDVHGDAFAKLDSMESSKICWHAQKILCALTPGYYLFILSVKVDTL